MGESVTEMLQFLCRLCARKDKSCVNVFSSDGDKYFIQKKIRLCLPVIVEEQDEMPRQICLSCLNKLESTYEFYTTCIYAQSTIQRLLKAKSLNDSDHLNKSGSEIKENIPTSFSLDQYLKRKIDLVDKGKSSKVPRTDTLEKDQASDNVHVETSKVSDTQASAGGGNSDSSVVTTNNSEFQFASTADGSSNICTVATNNSSAKTAETHKPKLRVKTTSELRQAAPTTTVTDCVSARLSLQESSAQSAFVPNTRQSTCVSASHSTSVAFSESAVPRDSRSTSAIPQRLKNSSPHQVKNLSALNGGKSWLPVVQSTKSLSPVVQLSKNSSALQTITSSPSTPMFITTSSSALQTGTSSLSAPKTAATVSLPLPNKVTSASSLQQYSLAVPTSSSSGCTILPKVSQFIIVPDTFASTPTFTAAGTNNVTVLARALPSNLSLVGDLSVPLGQATSLVAPQSTQPPLPVSVQPRTISTTTACTSLPLVPTMPLLSQPLSNPVMTPLTSTPAVINQSSTSGSVTYSVIKKNSQEFIISSNSCVAANTSTESVLSKDDGRHSTLSQVSRTPGGPSSNVLATRVSKDGKIGGSRSDTAVRGTGSATSTVFSKQNGSDLLRTNTVTVPRAVSHRTICPKPAASVVTSAKNVLRAHLIYTMSNSKKSSSVKPTQTTSGGSSSHNYEVLKGLLTYSNKSATKTNGLPADKRTTTRTPDSLPQAAVVTPVSSVDSAFSVSVGSVQQLKEGPAQQLKEGNSTIVIQTTKSNNSLYKQLPVTGVLTNAKTESRLSENQSQQKAAAVRPQSSGGLPPPPPTVPLNSVTISENRRKLSNNGCADSQNGEAVSTSGHHVNSENSHKRAMKNVEAPQKNCISSPANKSELTPKPHRTVATATVSPFTKTSQPASDPERQSPADPSSEQELELILPSSEPPAAEPGESSAVEVNKEECPYCHVEFPADILIHHKTLHYREKFYSCIDCDKNFVTEKGLESHRCQKESKG